MTDFVFALTDNVNANNDIDLVYDRNNQPDYASWWGIRLEQPEPDILLHTPDDGETQVIRSNDQDKRAFFSFSIMSGDNNVVTSKINRLKRWVDGKDSQAVMYEKGESDRPVYLKVQLKDTTRYTLHRVKWGAVDDSGVFYSASAHIHQWAVNGTIYLTLAPYGEGQPIYLKNLLVGSPGMTLDSNGDGLANGLTGTGSPTFSLSDTFWLIGGKSQKVVTDAAGTDGFTTAVVSIPRGTLIVAYVWLYHPGSGNQITVRLMDGSSNLIDSATFNSGATTNSDKTAVDERGNTWYRVSVSGTNSAAADAYLRVERMTGDASSATTFYADALYLGTSDAISKILVPTMDVDSDSDGVVDGWEESGTAIFSISNLFYFGSAESQEIDALPAASGKLTHPIECDLGSTITASLWIIPDTGSIDIHIFDGAGLAPLITKTISAADKSQATTSATGGDTNTWWRIDITATNNQEKNAQLVVQTSGGLFYIDNVNAYTGTFTVPDAWASPHVVKMRNDPDHSNPHRTNTLDVWGIPGDSDALVRMTLKRESITATAAEDLYASRFLTRIPPKHWFESGGSDQVVDEFSSMSWATTANAGSSGGSYLEGEHASPNHETFLYFEVMGDDVHKLLQQPVRVFGLFNIEVAGITFRFTPKLGAGSSATLLNTINVNEAVTCSAVDTWEWVDLGIMHAAGFYNPDGPNSPLRLRLYLEINLATAAKEFRMDALCLFPYTEFLIASSFGTVYNWTDRYFVDGRRLAVYDHSNTRAKQGGSLYYARPGESTNRYVFYMPYKNGTFDITKGRQVTLEIIPRARHLLGGG